MKTKKSEKRSIHVEQKYRQWAVFVDGKMHTTKELGLIFGIHYVQVSAKLAELRENPKKQVEWIEDRFFRIDNNIKSSEKIYRRGDEWFTVSSLEKKGVCRTVAYYKLKKWILGAIETEELFEEPLTPHEKAMKGLAASKTTVSEEWKSLSSKSRKSRLRLIPKPTRLEHELFAKEA